MTMVESNRATVLCFCDFISRRDFAGVVAEVTPDATWWVIGRPDYVQFGGLRQVTDVIKIITSFLGSLDEFSFDVGSSIAEGDHVAVEATSAGRKGTARYKNTYSMHFHLREGKIHFIREFMDPFEVNVFLEQLGLSSIGGT